MYRSNERYCEGKGSGTEEDTGPRKGTVKVKVQEQEQVQVQLPVQVQRKVL